MPERKCAACQAALDQDAIFCNECGQTQPLVVGAASRPAPSTEQFLSSMCPKCAAPLDGDSRFCSQCAFDTPVEEAIKSNADWERRVGFSNGVTEPNHATTVVSSKLAAAAKKRYKDGYLYAKTFEGIGILAKVLGFFFGGGVAFFGFVTGVGVAEQANRSPFGGPGAGVGVVIGFIFVAIGVLIWLILWIIGVIIKAGAQMIMAGFDSAVNSSPFLNMDDKAEVMSLIN